MAPRKKTKPRTNGHAAPAVKESAIVRLTTGGGSIGLAMIDDRAYELADQSMFGLQRAGNLGRHITRLFSLEALADVDGFTATPEQEAEYRMRLREIATLAVPSAPASVLDALPTGGLSDLVVGFLARIAATSPRLSVMIGSATEIANRSTGTSSSPSSRASTRPIRGSG